MKIPITILFLASWCSLSMADEPLVITDLRNSATSSALGTSWRLVTDGVMGGVSSGTLGIDTIGDKHCLRLRGDISLKNNGGFIQAALDVTGTAASDASVYRGILLKVFGNGEIYNLHLRTDDVWLPWQSYRAEFAAPARWQLVKLPFSAFSGYRIGRPLDLTRLKRIGIVAIGQEFTADLCIGYIAFYREDI